MLINPSHPKRGIKIYDITYHIYFLTRLDRKLVKLELVILPNVKGYEKTGMTMFSADI